MIVEQEMYVHIWEWDKDNEDREYYFYDQRDDNVFLCMGKTTVSFELPPMPSDDELNNRKIAFLQKGREEVTQEFSKKLANIDKQIEELRALPHLHGAG